MTRGEVWWADLAPRSGSEQRGRRPVVVVSHDGFNRVAAWQSVIVVPLSTSVRQARRGPTAIGLPRGVAGLPRASVALCHQVTTLDRAKLTRVVGMLPATYLGEVAAGLRAALELGQTRLATATASRFQVAGVRGAVAARGLDTMGVCPLGRDLVQRTERTAESARVVLGVEKELK